MNEQKNKKGLLSLQRHNISVLRDKTGYALSAITAFPLICNQTRHLPKKEKGYWCPFSCNINIITIPKSKKLLPYALYIFGPRSGVTKKSGNLRKKKQRYLNHNNLEIIKKGKIDVSNLKQHSLLSKNK